LTKSITRLSCSTCSEQENSGTQNPTNTKMSDTLEQTNPSLLGKRTQHFEADTTLPKKPKSAEDATTTKEINDKSSADATTTTEANDATTTYVIMDNIPDDHVVDLIPLHKCFKEMQGLYEARIEILEAQIETLERKIETLEGEIDRLKEVMGTAITDSETTRTDDELGNWNAPPYATIATKEITELRGAPYSTTFNVDKSTKVQPSIDTDTKEKPSIDTDIKEKPSIDTDTKEKPAE
jgi:hypothetical protein